MKLSSLIAATLSLTFFSLGNLAIAETVPHSQNSHNSSQNTVRSGNEKHLMQRNRDRRNSQERAKSIDYNIFSVAKDVEITLNNVGQSLDVEDKEWYIEKYPQQ